MSNANGSDLPKVVGFARYMITKNHSDIHSPSDNIYKKMASLKIDLNKSQINEGLDFPKNFTQFTENGLFDLNFGNDQSTNFKGLELSQNSTSLSKINSPCIQKNIDQNPKKCFQGSNKKVLNISNGINLQNSYNHNATASNGKENAINDKKINANNNISGSHSIKNIDHDITKVSLHKEPNKKPKGANDSKLDPKVNKLKMNLQNIKLDKVGTDPLYCKTSDILRDYSLINIVSASAATTVNKSFDLRKVSLTRQPQKSIEKKSSQCLALNNSFKPLQSPIRSPFLANSPNNAHDMNMQKVINNKPNRNKVPQKNRMPSHGHTKNNLILNTSTGPSNTSFSTNGSGKTKLYQSSDNIMRHSQSPEKSFLSQNNTKNRLDDSNEISQNIANIMISIPNVLETNKYQYTSKNSENSYNSSETHHQGSIPDINKSIGSPKYDGGLTDKQIIEMKNSLLSYYDMLIDRDISNTKVLENLKSNFKTFMQEFTRNYQLLQDYNKIQEEYEERNDKLIKQIQNLESKVEILKKENECLLQKLNSRDLNSAISNMQINSYTNASTSQLSNPNGSISHDSLNVSISKQAKDRKASVKDNIIRKQELIKENEKLKSAIQKQQIMLLLAKKKEEKYIKLLFAIRKSGVDVEQIYNDDINSTTENSKINTKINTLATQKQDEICKSVRNQDEMNSNTKENLCVSILTNSLRKSSPNSAKDSEKQNESEAIINEQQQSFLKKSSECSNSAVFEDQKNCYSSLNKFEINNISDIENLTKRTTSRIINNTQNKSASSNSVDSLSSRNHKDIITSTSHKNTFVNRSKPNLKLNLNLLRKAESADGRVSNQAKDQGLYTNEIYEPLGFHQEFMARINEFSLSWRQAVMQEKKI